MNRSQPDPETRSRSAFAQDANRFRPSADTRFFRPRCWDRSRARRLAVSLLSSATMCAADALRRRFPSHAAPRTRISLAAALPGRERWSRGRDWSGYLKRIEVARVVGICRHRGGRHEAGTGRPEEVHETKPVGSFVARDFITRPVVLDLLGILGLSSNEAEEGQAGLVVRPTDTLNCTSPKPGTVAGGRKGPASER